ncbi:MAG: kelch repeat-containing protein [Actinomycetota bacterium]
MSRVRGSTGVRARRPLIAGVLVAVVVAGLLPAAAGARGAPVGFGKSDLAGEISVRPTSLQFGPDGRLYVAQLDGTINAYSIVREGPNDYEVAASESIERVRSIPNHHDDGTPATEITGRFVTGLLLTGTSAHPVIYVTSSDPRIGGIETGDTGLDTNSGTLSRLRWNGTTWKHRVLVRGLPRSEEVHASNGMTLDPATATLYLAQGGNTNMGAPSASFAHLPEYALSGAILSVDLEGLGPLLPYDLPTLNDRTRPGVPDANDPFGGNDGRNQAKIVPGGPVQVHSPGFRNPYDVLLASNGSLYATDNGANAGAGGLPVGEGPAGTCTDEPTEPGFSGSDSLHLIEGPGEYHGAPNPTRGNTANVWGQQSPVAVANPVECDWLEPGPERGSLATFPESTNGLAEYTASNFGGAMQGDLLAPTLLDNLLYRITLTPDGTQASSVQALFSSVAKRPLDVTAQSDAGPFPGTIWVADQPMGRILVFEPNDFGGPPPACSGDDDATLDEDADGYDNADEIANGTDPCSAGDVPPDADGDFISDRADPDDDNDGGGDTVDPFALDPDDGRTTELPLSLTWDPGEDEYGGLVESGFTGLMTDLTTDYLDRFDPSAMTVGSATGTLAIDAVGDGTARGNANTQRFGLQTGLDVSGGAAFRVRGRIVAPFAGTSPEPGQEIGVFIGTGTQDAYVQVVLTSGGVSAHRERGGTIDRERTRGLALPGPDAVDVMLDVDPAARTVQPRFSIPGGGGSGTVGAPIPIPAGWLDGPEGLAVGLISTSRGPAPAFPAVWDFLKANPTGGAAREASGSIARRGQGAWVFRAPTGFPRSEVSYTAVGHRFYLAWGGLLHQFFNPVKNRWHTLASLPQALNHIQAVAFRKKIYSLGGLEMGPGSPKPSSGTVWIYDPESDSFASGTPMPEGRERGAGGVARHDGLLYYLGGLHDGVAVPWVDVYDPVADTWESLPDMPRARDHFQAAVIGDVLYAIGGRTGNGTTPFGHNDALDLQTGEWTTGLEPLPTPRAGYAVAVLGPEILVIGGEGNGKAYRKVEAYLPSGDSWRTLARMNVPRHGIQAVVHNARVFVAAGGRTQGGDDPTGKHEHFTP